jgi:phenylacetic acid degradation operon negative regulatory protein
MTVQLDGTTTVTPQPEGRRRAQHLILTLMGDYWLAAESWVPSGALVDLLAEFGVGTSTVRAALSRLTRRGVLVISRTGRRTNYALSAESRHLGSTGLARLVSFGRGPDAWSGEWTVVAFSLPEEQRGARNQLRTRLRWLGFASLYDGLWLSPRNLTEEVGRILQDEVPGSATVMIAREPAFAFHRHPIQAWDVDSIRRGYLDFMEGLAPIDRRLRGGHVSPAEALRARTEVMDTWRSMPDIDPDLPLEILPAGWPREPAAELFRRVYDGLGKPATLHVQQIVELHDPDSVRLVRAHTTQD